METKSILIFGAGKIGRALVGQLFSRAGFEVVFADIDISIINELNRRRAYPVLIKDTYEDQISVPYVRAIHSENEDALVCEIVKASLVCISVGKNALQNVLPIVAKGLTKRFYEGAISPLDIILAENMCNAAQYVKTLIMPLLPKDYPAEQMPGLIETSIGKMVPDVPLHVKKVDPLLLIAEAYNSLIVDVEAFKNVIPDIKGLIPKTNMPAWVDRKAFIHNMGHACVAYYGAFRHPDAKYIYEVLEDPQVFSFSRRAMLKSAEILHQIYYKAYSMQDLVEHVDDLLFRFKNKALADTIYRVGRDRIRKLGPDDRFMGIIRKGLQVNIEPYPIFEAMSHAFYFDARDELCNKSQNDILFDKYMSKGVGYVLVRVCGLHAVKDLGIKRKLQWYNSNVRVCDGIGVER